MTYMADYKISLGIALDDNDLGTQVRALRTNERIQIGVELNDNVIQTQIASIRRQIEQIGNIRINIGGNISGGGGTGRGNNGFIGNISNNISQITTTANNATNTIQRLRQTLASARFNNASMDLVTQHLEQMDLAITNVTSRIRNNNLRLNITGTDELGRTVTVLKEINLATGEITNIGKNINQSFGRSREEINQTNAAYREMKSLIGEITNTSIKINNARAVGQEFGALEQKLAALNARYDELEANFAGGFDVNQTRNISNEWAKVAHDVNIANEAITSSRTNLASSIRESFSGYDAQVQSLVERIGKLSSESDEVSIGLGRVKKALFDMKNASNDNELIAAEERYQQALKETEAQLKKNKSLESQVNNTAALAQSKEKLSLTMSNWLKDNSKAARLFGDDIKNLQKQLKQCGNSVDVKRISDSFGIVKQKAKEAGVATKTFGDSLKAQFAKYKDYLSIATIFMYTTQALKSMFDQVLAIDTAMTELKKVTDETDASYNQFLSNAASRAKEIGTTIDGLVASTADFARLGYGFKESQGLAEVANIYAVVGDDIDSVETATQSLISTLTAFKDEANGLSNDEFALSIVDKMNEVSNNFAISSGGIGEALQRSASSMMAANNSLDETIALITAANTVVQDPDSVGTAFKTSFLNCLYVQKCA